MPRLSPKSLAVTLVKWTASLAIITWLVIGASRDPSFSQLANGDKHWGLLSGALACCLSAVMLTIARWHLLVRALDLPFRLRDAFRLGFLGYLLNFVSLGGVGGDVFKAVFIAREHPERRAEAVATVIADRIIGLFSLFVAASTAILLSGELLAEAGAPIQWICRATLVGTAIGAVGMLALMLPGATSNPLSRAITRLPKVGPLAAKILAAVQMYRRQPVLVLAGGVMSLVTHALFSLTFYLIAVSILADSPSLASHFVMVPLAMITGVLPLPVNGLGAFEGVLEFLYRNIPLAAAGQGLVVALGYRLISVLIALVGMCYYFASRREMQQAVDQAEEVGALPMPLASESRGWKRKAMATGANRKAG